MPLPEMVMIEPLLPAGRRRVRLREPFQRRESVGAARAFWALAFAWFVTSAACAEHWVESRGKRRGPAALADDNATGLRVSAR